MARSEPQRRAWGGAEKRRPAQAGPQHLPKHHSVAIASNAFTKILRALRMGLGAPRPDAVGWHALSLSEGRGAVPNDAPLARSERAT